MAINLLKRKNKPIPECSAVIVAAGMSERMGGDKLKMELMEKPVLAHTLAVFEDSPFVSEIIVVTREDELLNTAQLCADYNIHKAAAIVIGGESRRESSLIGVTAVKPGAKLIAVHDGARPLVTQEIIAAAVEGAAVHFAAVPCISVKDTVKVKDHEGFVKQSLVRGQLVAVQTPQVFEGDIIKAALTAALNRPDNITDDCMAVEAMGIRPYIVNGSEENIKITTPIDLLTAQGILQKRREACE